MVREKREGLGERFLQIFQQKLETIQFYPERFSLRKNNFREAPLQIFPYPIVYKFHKRKKEIIVFHIFHTKRNPRNKLKK